MQKAIEIEDEPALPGEDTQPLDVLEALAHLEARAQGLTTQDLQLELCST